ncbi:leucine-rich repeat extensin-like protein 4 [Canna indica]|uniref:Leucine-rich repeat extensin-like protein 4 n=1 Tax=Canna indica TaxID=4628 RepID=A0AAQ3KQC9_9LILI|nr:leucine-rich repeat extensin-like protein 4 [Canna indica]
MAAPLELLCFMLYLGLFFSTGVTTLGEEQRMTLGGEGTADAESLAVDPSYQFPNSRLRDAYIALQTWKHIAIFSDPQNLTAN